MRKYRKNKLELTKKQREALFFIECYIEKYKMPPTVREIGYSFKRKSSTIFSLIKQLKLKGYLAKTRLKSRALIVLKSVIF